MSMTRLIPQHSPLSWLTLHFEYIHFHKTTPKCNNFFSNPQFFIRWVGSQSAKQKHPTTSDWLCTYICLELLVRPSDKFSKVMSVFWYGEVLTCEQDTDPRPTSYLWCREHIEKENSAQNNFNDSSLKHFVTLLNRANISHKAGNCSHYPLLLRLFSCSLPTAEEKSIHFALTVSQ